MIGTLRPIGHVESDIVESDIKEPAQFRWEASAAEVVVDPAFASGLDGIEDFSHVIVICWLDRIDEPQRRTLKAHPQNRQDLPEVGVFATRSPRRPNPVSITVVALRERRNNRLVVEGLDAVDGTPVLDIKPYLPREDSVPDARVAWWINKLWEDLDAGHAG